MGKKWEVIVSLLSLGFGVVGLVAGEERLRRLGGGRVLAGVPQQLEAARRRRREGGDLAGAHGGVDDLVGAQLRAAALRLALAVRGGARDGLDRVERAGPKRPGRGGGDRAG